MSESTPQNLKNHGRLDPPYHMVLFGVLLVNLVIVITYTVMHFSIFSGWLLIMSIAVFIPFAKLRTYPA
jgi:hypothetical protein